MTIRYTLEPQRYDAHTIPYSHSNCQDAATDENIRFGKFLLFRLLACCHHPFTTNSNYLSLTYYYSSTYYECRIGRDGRRVRSTSAQCQRWELPLSETARSVQLYDMFCMWVHFNEDEGEERKREERKRKVCREAKKRRRLPVGPWAPAEGIE